MRRVRRDIIYTTVYDPEISYQSTCLLFLFHSRYLNLILHNIYVLDYSRIYYTLVYCRSLRYSNLYNQVS